jgi:hypothetical protein
MINLERNQCIDGFDKTFVALIANVADTGK